MKYLSLILYTPVIIILIRVALGKESEFTSYRKWQVKGGEYTEFGKKFNRIMAAILASIFIYLLVISFI